MFVLEQQRNLGVHQKGANNNTTSSEFLPSETLDNFLAKDSPIEFEAWKRDRGLQSTTDSQQQKEDISNTRLVSNMLGKNTDELDTTGYMTRRQMMMSQQQTSSQRTTTDPWWSVDSRGAERRETKLLERRGARVTAATNLLMNQQHNSHFGGNLY